MSEAILAVTPMETVKVKFIADQRSANPQFKVNTLFLSEAKVLRKKCKFEANNYNKDCENFLKNKEFNLELQ